MNYEQHVSHRFTDDRYPNVRVVWEEYTQGQSEVLYIYQWRNGQWRLRDSPFDPYPYTLYHPHMGMDIHLAEWLARIFFDGEYRGTCGQKYGPEGATTQMEVTL